MGVAESPDRSLSARRRGVGDFDQRLSKLTVEQEDPDSDRRDRADSDVSASVGDGWAGTNVRDSPQLMLDLCSHLKGYKLAEAWVM